MRLPLVPSRIGVDTFHPYQRHVNQGGARYPKILANSLRVLLNTPEPFGLCAYRVIRENEGCANPQMEAMFSNVRSDSVRVCQCR
jgi:hypothetical protein